MQAYFLSKQEKIGDLQPIILLIDGDDYNSITIIILNKYNRPISGFNLTGGMNSGPTEKGDSVLEYESHGFSLIDGRNITSVRFNHIDFISDSLKKPSIIDSVVFSTLIDKVGHIKTRKLMSKKFLVPYKDASK